MVLHHRVRRLWTVVLTAGALAAGCADEEATWRADLVNAENPPVEGVAVPGDGWTARFGRDCGQIELDEVRTWCPEFTGTGPGGLATPLRAGDDRIVWIVQQSGGGDADADPRFAPVDHAVVWSSSAPEGRRVAVAVFGDLQQLAWILEDGEEPWGVQLIDARGRLVTTHHLAGLPGT